MIRPTRDAATIRPGETLPGFSKTFGAADLVAYGAATWDWHRLHYDLDYAKAVKLPNVILDGQAYGALFARQAMDWGGPRAFISKLGFRMRAMTFAGDTLRAEGEVAEVRAGPGGAVVVLAQRLKLGDGRLAADCTTELRVSR
jgi:acyl dehydratase